MGLVSFAASTPINVQTRDIFDPPVLVPNANTVWQAGSTQTVFWDASNPPKSISNLASIVLRLSSDINFSAKLASGFSLLTGNQTIQLPSDLQTAEDYFVILFGDSGNVSPDFTITAA
ncbi:hypothetical protein Clacol_001361 [Clathrus columnatus]|uniref:Yeast cell wall synthesis Kre9/Knh1-like N-terminal domain-containing protein n=1 Tax=Clathrus columnatus TaxID=1419009 RepID=A0AAV5A3L0_9AGAM|nr:hypothetical protein Clacol_001361 [Clathrus columnatus]